jgi:hypothetical protein
MIGGGKLASRARRGRSHQRRAEIEKLVSLDDDGEAWCALLRSAPRRAAAANGRSLRRPSASRRRRELGQLLTNDSQAGGERMTA